MQECLLGNTYCCGPMSSLGDHVTRRFDIYIRLTLVDLSVLSLNTRREGGAVVSLIKTVWKSSHGGNGTGGRSSKASRSHCPSLVPLKSVSHSNLTPGFVGSDGPPCPWLLVEVTGRREHLLDCVYTRTRAAEHATSRHCEDQFTVAIWKFGS